MSDTVTITLSREAAQALLDYGSGAPKKAKDELRAALENPRTPVQDSEVPQGLGDEDLLDGVEESLELLMGLVRDLLKDAEHTYEPGFEDAPHIAAARNLADHEETLKLFRIFLGRNRGFPMLKDEDRERLLAIANRIEKARDRGALFVSFAAVDGDAALLRNLADHQQEPCYCTDDYPATPGCEDCKGTGYLPKGTRADHQQEDSGDLRKWLKSEDAVKVAYEATGGEGSPHLRNILAALAQHSSTDEEGKG